jgi:salicylate hydroxylase
MTEQIVVSGAGIGGLCAVLALVQRGFDVVVCEQASELREVGAGVQLSPNGTRVLASLGVLDDLRAVAVEAEAKEIRLWNSGEKWPLFDLCAAAMAEYGFPYLMVHRGDLQTVLAKGRRACRGRHHQTGGRGRRRQGRRSCRDRHPCRWQRDRRPVGGWR